jgi:hypothetical protein
MEKYENMGADGTFPHFLRNPTAPSSHEFLLSGFGKMALQLET